MEADETERCQELLDYRFSDVALLSQALTHASVATSRVDSNERLEFLGDAVLGLVVCHELYDRFDDLLEGEMTKIKSSVVSRQTCAEVAMEMGICDLLSLGKGLPASDRLPQSVAAAVFEAIIGAIFLDGGLQDAGRFILRHLSDRIDAAMEDEHQRNYKSQLQQYAQRRWSTTPDYHLLDEKGPDHDKAFEVAVAISDQHFPSAWGKNKKEAEQRAAKVALGALGLLSESDAPPVQ